MSRLSSKFLERMSVQKRVSLLLSDLDADVWVKFHARHSADESKHPMLVLQVRGQGIYHTYIRPANPQIQNVGATKE